MREKIDSYYLTTVDVALKRYFFNPTVANRLTPMDSYTLLMTVVIHRNLKIFECNFVLSHNEIL